MDRTRGLFWILSLRDELAEDWLLQLLHHIALIPFNYRHCFLAFGATV